MHLALRCLEGIRAGFMRCSILFKLVRRGLKHFANLLTGVCGSGARAATKGEVVLPGVHGIKAAGQAVTGAGRTHRMLGNLV